MCQGKEGISTGNALPVPAKALAFGNQMCFSFSLQRIEHCPSPCRKKQPCVSQLLPSARDFQTTCCCAVPSTRSACVAPRVRHQHLHPPPESELILKLCTRDISLASPWSRPCLLYRLIKRRDTEVLHASLTLGRRNGKPVQVHWMVMPSLVHRYSQSSRHPDL